MDGKGGMETPVLIRFAQKLAGNEKKQRTAAMKKLRKWLTAKSQNLHGGLSRDDLIKIWKGLHYCMWMSDKPLVQEELAGTISDLIHCFPHFPQALLFVDTFFETECREWFGIDHLRLDKFMMLIRQVFRRMLKLLKSHKWKKLYIEQVTSMLAKHIITSAWDDDIPDGIRFHVADIYLEELDHADTELSTDRVHMFLEPYCVALTKMKINTLFNHIVKHIFIELINWEMQKAEIMEYNNQVRAAAAEAAEHDDEEGKGEEDDDELKEQEIRKHIQVDYKRLADRLFELASNAACPGKNRTAIYGLVKRFSNLAEGKLPKRLTYDDIKHEKGITTKDIRRAAHELMELELKLEKQSSKALKKKRKKLKRRRAKQRNSTEAELDDNKESDHSSESGGGDDDDDDDEPSSKKRRSSTQIVISAEKKITGYGNSQGFDTVTSKEMDTPSKKLKKKKKHVHMTSEVLSSSCDDFISENIINEFNEKQTVKSKQNKKHKKEVNIATSCSFVDEDSFMEDLNDVEPSKNTATKPADSNSTACDSSVSKLDPSHLKQGNISSDINTTNHEVLNDKCGKKRVKKRSPGKGILDPSLSGLKKSEKLIFTGGFVSDSDEETVPQSGGPVAINTNTSDDTAVTPVTKKKTNSEGALVSFKKVKHTPPAFVKRAIKKVSTQKTEAKKPVAKTAEDVAPGTSPSLSKKKVIFAMNKNRAQDFSESLMVSPVLPFDPKQKPDQGILRSSPAISDSPAMKSPRTKLFLKRAKAADYF